MKVGEGGSFPKHAVRKDRFKDRGLAMNTFSSYETQELFYADRLHQSSDSAHSKETAEVQDTEATKHKEGADCVMNAIRNGEKI